jgi:hypothetical protein
MKFMEMNTEGMNFREVGARMCATATVFSGNILTSASADRVELFTGERTVVMNILSKKSQKK